MAARKASQTIVKDWLSDPAAYPIIGVISFACCLATFQGVRYITTSPDVTFDKHKRTATLHYTEEDGQNFRAHRQELAHMRSNRITQSKMYDGFYKAEEK